MKRDAFYQKIKDDPAHYLKLYFGITRVVRFMEVFNLFQEMARKTGVRNISPAVRLFKEKGAVPDFVVQVISAMIIEGRVQKRTYEKQLPQVASP